MSQNQQLSASNMILDVLDALDLVLADMFALYVRTKNSIGAYIDTIFATITCCLTIKRRRFLRRRT